MYNIIAITMVFQKGQPSANPNGRPIGSLSLVDILRRKLGEVPPGTSNTRAEAIVDAYLKDVMEKPEMKKDAFDRIDGKPKQSVGIEGEGEDGAIEIRVKMV